PEGFLFLCPSNDLKSADGTFLERPESPAYWSLDPIGRKKLTPDEASRLGFPALKLKRQVLCAPWDHHFYASLAQFHVAKGFDPHSQDVSRHLGEPLYEL
ncbi:hypothetical protein B0H13DRAFT_1542587, partial [Mycena leptocephala]